MVVGGVTSRGGLFCPADSEGIYTVRARPGRLS
jgi:hypothetical protein